MANRIDVDLGSAQGAIAIAIILLMLMYALCSRYLRNRGQRLRYLWVGDNRCDEPESQANRSIRDLEPYVHVPDLP